MNAELAGISVPTSHPTSTPTSYPSQHPSATPTGSPTEITNAPTSKPTLPLISRVSNGMMRMYDTSNLKFSFDLTLSGGQYFCEKFNPAVLTGSTSTVEFAFTTNANQYASDFTVLFLTNGDLSSSEYIGKTNAGISYKEIAAYDTTYDQVTDKCVRYTTTSAITSGFTEVCVLNLCGSMGIFCPNMARLKGQISVSSFSTTSPAEKDNIRTTCVLGGGVVTNVLPTLSPTSPAPSQKPSVPPTVRPSAAKSVNPTRRPTTTPSKEPTANPSGKVTRKPTISPSFRASAKPTVQPTKGSKPGAAIKLVSKASGELAFKFDVTLAGGNYICKTIDAAVSLDEHASNSFVSFSFSDVNIKGHWVSDFVPFVMTNNAISTAQYIGGNSFGMEIGNERLAVYPAYFNQYLSSCVDFNQQISLITPGFTQVCVFNSCGSNNIYCQDSTNFKGEIIFDKFTTSSAIESDTINPQCTASSTTPSR